MRGIVVIVFLGLAFSSIAQNTTRYSQLNFAQGVNNPAAIAIDGSMMVDLIFRNQWLGIEGAPTTVALNGQYEITQRMAVGLLAGHDRIGATQTNSFAGQYAYRLPFEYSNFLSFGIGLGIDNFVNDYTYTVTTQADDPAFATSFSKIYMNGSVGVFYNSPKFYIGASIPQLFQNTRSGAEIGFRPPRWHYYLSTGFYLSAGDRYTFNPHIQLKTAMNTPIQGDIILRNTFLNRFSVVVGYRSENSIIAGFDILITPYVRAGYSFNHDVGKLSKVKSASNELYLGLAFPYHSDRYSFGKRKYYNKKGLHKSDFRKNSQRKQFRGGRKYGRKTKYR